MTRLKSLTLMLLALTGNASAGSLHMNVIQGASPVVVSDRSSLADAVAVSGGANDRNGLFCSPFVVSNNSVSQNGTPGYAQGVSTVSSMRDSNSVPDFQGQVCSNSADYEKLVVGEKLTPSPVPLPAAGWLFGSALVGFVAISSRRRI